MSIPLLPIAIMLALSASLARAADARPAPGPALARPSVELRDLVDRAVEAVRTEPETLFQLTSRALELLAEQPDVDLEARVRLLRCDYFNERDRDATLRELDLLRALAPRLRSQGLQAGILACEGELNEQAGENTGAMALYGRAVDVAEKAGDERRLAEALYLRGYLLGVLGEFPRGLTDLRRSLALYERLKLPMEVRTVANGVASLYNRIGAHEDSRKIYEDALRSLPQGLASREGIVARHNLGRSLERLERWDEARSQYEKALADARELDFARGEVHALRGLASVHNAQGDGAAAMRLLESALRLSAKVPDAPLKARLLVQRATALRLLSRPEEGLPLLREALKAFTQGDTLAEEAETRDELARTAAALLDWRLAHEQLSRARRISQELLRRQIDHRFATIKAQFDIESKEREFALLQREHRANEAALAGQRRAATLQIVAAVLASALAVLLGLLAWRQRHTGRQMRVLAMTDDLTGLPNRRQALAELQKLIDRGSADGALLILDIDHFKRINDEHGHPAGDEVLRRIAAHWRALALPGVTLGRLGGEEFVAVMNQGGLEQAMVLGESLRQRVAGLDVSNGLGLRAVAVSVGVTALQPKDTLAAVLARADQALYRAKAGGRNRVESAS